MMPVTIHATRSQPGEPSLRPMSAETMKMPDPIIDPATSIVASVRVIALTNSGVVCGASVVFGGAATLVMQLLGLRVRYRWEAGRKAFVPNRRQITQLYEPAALDASERDIKVRVATGDRSRSGPSYESARRRLRERPA